MENLYKNYLSLSFLALVLLVGACKKEDVMTPAKSSDKTMSSFSFGSLTPSINATIAGTAVTAMVPFSVDVTSLAPTISLAAKATVSPASGTAQNFTNVVTYTVTAEDGTTTAYAVTVTKGIAPKSTAKDITKLSFAALSPAVDATIDETAKTIKATLPAATDLTKLVPTITLSDKATINPASGTAQDFSKEVSYTVTAEDASTVVYKVNVKKEVVASAGFTITTKAKMPVIADMDTDNIIFTINSKIYYLGNSKASTRDFKYFFEYDPAANKWTQKADFSFKANLDGTGFPLKSNFIHNDKAYFSSNYYGFMEYDPLADKWTSLNYKLSRFENNPLYFQGSLFGFNVYPSTYEFDTKKSKGYKMSGAEFFSKMYGGDGYLPFVVDDKIYIQTFFNETATAKQRFDTYEVDYANSKYIKRVASFEGEQKYGTMGNTGSNTSKGNAFSGGYFVDGKVYYFSVNNVLIYDGKNDAFQTVKTPQNSSPFQGEYSVRSFVVIGKSIYILNYNKEVISLQVP